MPTGVLCRAIQELDRCLTPLLERGDLIDLEMLDMARKDPMTPVPAERASSLRPRVEEPISIPAPNKPPASGPQEAAKSEELALVQRRRPRVPPKLTLSWVMSSTYSPQKEMDWPVSITLGAQLDLTSFRSLQVTVSYYPIMGRHDISAKPGSLPRCPYN